jgi:hypothetical protein
MLSNIYKELLKKMINGEEKLFFINQVQSLMQRVQVYKNKIEYARCDNADILQLVSIN